VAATGELWFLALGGATLIGAMLCYVAARFALLSNWRWLTGVFRLLAVWLIAAWMGYGTPIYVALVVLPLALLWRQLQRNLIPLLVFELSLGLCLAWHSPTPLLPINVATVLLVDQVLGRLALLNFNRPDQARSGQTLYRLLLCLGLIGVSVLGAPFQRAAISKHVASHSLMQSLDLVPLGAAWFWYQPRELPLSGLPEGIPPSVYWQARTHCRVRPRL